MQRVEIVDGVYQVRMTELTPRIGAALHKTLWAHIGILDADGTTAPDEGAT
jgi:hypothetical protein